MKNKILMILATVLIISACSKNEKISPEKPIPVTTVIVEMKDAAIPLTTSGKVSAEMETILSFKTGGIVRTIFVNEGQSVKQGAVLAELDLSEINAQVNQAEENFLKAQRDFKRVQSLYKDSVVTLEQFQNTETALSVAKSSLEVAKFNLNYSKIKAPVDGKIFRKLVEENQMISAGSAVILFGATSDSWIIKSGISDKQITKFKLGDHAKISIDAFPQNKFSGKITEIASSANPTTGTYEIEITFKTNVKVISGMVAEVELFSEEKISGYLLPIKTLVNVDGKNASVFIPLNNSNGVKKINVTLGEILEENVFAIEYEENINEVIADGIEYITESSKIEVVKKEK